MILAPHPDDEVVGCAAAIGRARSKGASIFVMFLTTGVPAQDLLWPWQRSRHAAMVAQRRKEALAAAEFLIVEPQPFNDIATRTLRLHIEETSRAVTHFVDRHRIDRLWVPAYEGGHQDHDTANFVASRIETEVETWEYAAYNFAGGSVSCHSFIDPGGDEVILDLTPEETTRKRAALSIYASEKGNLDYITVDRECFRPLATYDYTRPPHPGRTFYQRFQWIPIRHPRVDVTTPEEVCHTFAAASKATEPPGPAPA